MNPFDSIDIKKFIDSIPQEEIDRQTRLQAEENKRVYSEFIAALSIGKCFMCGGQLDSFDEQKPCFHWFLHPIGIKKKHFEKYLEKPIGFFQLDSYFRWFANSERPFGNINDLKDETSVTSYLETTYRYKNIEWAFSIGHSDKVGHVNGKVGSVPHYHIQMKVGDHVFLNFNHFHIPFSDNDLFTISMLDQASDKVKLGHSFGQGIGILEDKESLEIIDEFMTVTDDVENAIFNRETFIEAPEGETISGELFLQAIEESKKTKQPIGRIMQRLKSDAKIISIITPGEGVAKMTKRSGKK